jgi:uncharacterized low-complexity protein
MSRFVLPLTALTFLTGIFAGDASTAQDEKERRSELGVRQKLVERRMTELENKLTLIADRLREKEPERAARLVEAYQQSKELLITKKMAEVSELLNQDQFNQADQKLDEVIKSVESLIRILVDEKEPPMSKEQEMEMLERWKQKIEERINEQREQRRETEKISDKDQAVKNLEGQIKKLESLIDKQKEVIEATEQNQGAGLRALDQVADKQFEIRQATEALNLELGSDERESLKRSEPLDPDGQPGKKAGGSNEQTGDPKSGDPMRNEPESSEPESSEPESSEPESSESKIEKSATDQQKAGQSNSVNSKSGESKSGESKSGESKSGESKSGESKSGESKKSQQASQPGQRPLTKAAENQLKAEERLSSGKALDAKRQAQDALANLEQALKELQKEKRRIESLPPEALEQMAEAQRRTRDKAMKLVEEMKVAPKPEAKKSAGGDEQSQTQSPPGQKPMEEASESMQQASKSLDEGQPGEAQEKQKKSQQKMEQARNDIEDRLNQLREETREEKLARLEARFQEMLERQIAASVMTVELDDRKASLKELRRRDQLSLLQMSNEELEISEIGQQTYDLLLEDGTSIVFPEIVQELRQELEKAAQLLQAQRTDQITQIVQKEIEFTIQDLLDALKQAKKDSKEGGGGGGGGGGENPLIKKADELKMLRVRQLRLNRRAKKIEQIRGTEELEPMIKLEAEDAAKVQRSLIEMLERILEKESG